MTFFQAFILALVQGLTEFLPISSSGHLAVLPFILKFDKPSLFFDILVHMGTLLAVVFFLRVELWEIIQGILKNSKASWILVGKILLAVVPAGLSGVLLKDQIEPLFSNPARVGWAYFGTMLILFLMVLFYKGKKTMADLSWTDALIIGLFQAMALVPGFSRSGFTLFGALLVGMKKTDALRFSFLISIPAILGAFVLELGTMDSNPVAMGMALFGLVVSALAGFGAILLLKHYLKNSRLHMFGLYCLGMGILLVSLFR